MKNFLLRRINIQFLHRHGQPKYEYVTLSPHCISLGAPPNLRKEHSQRPICSHNKLYGKVLKTSCSCEVIL
jgi:hypothetical protein